MPAAALKSKGRMQDGLLRPPEVVDWAPSASPLQHPSWVFPQHQLLCNRPLAMLRQGGELGYASGLRCALCMP